MVEFLLLFVAVISAFSLNKWNENRKDEIAETKILNEIINGLERDIEDANMNVFGHKLGLSSCRFWSRIIENKDVYSDSVTVHYMALTRDFISIQNISAYETLKSKGFELIENDSLRTQIVALYEFDYQILKKLEEEYHEMQFYENYFSEFHKVIASNLLYDEKANITGIQLPLTISNREKNILLGYVNKIQINRRYILKFYDRVIVKINDLKANIESELSHPYD